MIHKLRDLDFGFKINRFTIVFLFLLILGFLNMIMCQNFIGEVTCALVYKGYMFFYRSEKKR